MDHDLSAPTSVGKHKREDDETYLSDDDNEQLSDRGEYSEDVEKMPRFAAYDPELHLVTERILRITNKAHRVLHEVSCETADVEKLRGKVEQVLAIPSSERKVIGLLGNSGQGKS